MIDDEPVDQWLYRRTIEQSGLVEELHQFTSGQDALDFLEARPGDSIDAILLDVRMPEMNGFEFLDAATAQLGDRFAAVVVIMLTTSLDPKDRARAEQLELVKDYLNKPLTSEGLTRVVELIAEARQVEGGATRH